MVRDLGYIDEVKPNELALLYHYNIYPNKTNYKIKKLDNLEYTRDNLPQNKVFLETEIYSIDPAGCKDIDDAFSIRKKEKDVFIDIHIADVYSFIKRHNLIEKIDNTTSVYLDNSILHMIDSNILIVLVHLLKRNIGR